MNPSPRPPRPSRSRSGLALVTSVLIRSVLIRSVLVRSVLVGSVLVAVPLTGCEGGGAPGASRESLATHPALAPLDPPSREAVARSPVPVLLLPEPYADTSTVTAARGFYAIAAEDGELSVSLHATDVVHAAGDGVPAPPRQHTVRGRPALVLVNEGIRSVTWEEGATSYVLEVECYRPFEDARCTEAAFVLDLADALVEVDR